MIPGTAGRFAAVAPGAETVGQARILTEFSKLFDPAGLFGAVDEPEGAFAPGEVTMGDDTPVRLPLKRSHSPGSGFGSGPDPGTRSGVTQRLTSDVWSVRTPKRSRKAKDLSAYEEVAAESHPLRKKTLKKARRAATRL